jgi:hypothetical protein
VIRPSHFSLFDHPKNIWWRVLAGVVGSNPAEGMDVSLMSVMCYQIQVSASGWSLVQRSPTDCGVSECDHESSIMRRPWLTVAVAPWQKKKSHFFMKNALKFKFPTPLPPAFKG